MDILKSINAALAFFLELTMLVAFSYWGFHGDKSNWMKWVLGIGTPVVVAVIWGLFLAPKADYRLDMMAGIVLSLVLFAAAVIALYQTGHPAMAITFALLIIFNRIFLLIWQQW